MKVLLVFLGSLLGCGGTDFTASSVETGGNGTGGEEGGSGGLGGEGGESGGENQGGQTNGSSSTGASTSSGCQPSVTCQSLGAECGTIQDDGCGNTVECPNNCQAPLTCGGNGEQFKCGCTPKSCLLQGKNCGFIDDGCGQMIDCGTCQDPNNYYLECGGKAPDPYGNPQTGTPNVCGGGCKNINSLYCVTTFGPPYNFTIKCTSYDENHPAAPGCIPAEVEQGWCCPMAVNY